LTSPPEPQRIAGDLGVKPSIPMTDEVDTSKTLDELDPPAWGEPPYDSYLVTTCHRLRKKPLAQFSVEDLRIMIGQGISLQWLVPVALGVLDREPLSEGDFYQGDLLASVLRIDSSFWAKHQQWRERVLRRLNRLEEIPNELNDAIATFRRSTA
jgi:hypothetical protein